MSDTNKPEELSNEDLDNVNGGLDYLVITMTNLKDDDAANRKKPGQKGLLGDELGILRNK